MAAVDSSALTVMADPAKGNIVRFDIHQRIQHFGLMSSFVVLTFTGLPLKFHNLAISQWWIGVWGGVENTRAIHHFAAWVMGVTCIYHLAYVLYGSFYLKRPLSHNIIPRKKDVLDLIQDLLYYLRLRETGAQYDRFNYREKFDYWAVFWGMYIMGGSGLVLMYPVFMSHILPSWAVPVALVAHSDESLLAVGWIFIVHLFFTHLYHLAFPFNSSIFTGKVPVERYRQEHPLEYQRLFLPQEEKVSDDSPNSSPEEGESTS